MKKGLDSDPNGHILSTPHQWSDILNPDLPLLDFEAVLLGVLRSTVEMEKVKELNAQEFQSVIDVLGQVSTSLIQRSQVYIR